MRSRSVTPNRNGEIGADVEEIVLDPVQRLAEAIREV